MKIGEFAERHQVTTKMLRHYDEVGLLKPSRIDPLTGYRSYEPEQSHRLNWIIILKNLDFSLNEIREVLSGPVDSERIIRQLIRKRISITSAMNEQTQKKIAIDQLIHILEKEGFRMDRKIDLLHIGQDSVHEIKKNIPNMEMFLESAAQIAAMCSAGDEISVFRFDISHFKGINDDFGFDVGDNVIVACFHMIESKVREHLPEAAIGRAHGDEFVVFAKAGEGELGRAASGIVENMKRYDFSAIGCKRQMGCYIGGLVARNETVSNIRSLIEDSIEVIERAREQGTNTVAIEAYRGS